MSQLVKCEEIKQINNRKVVAAIRGDIVAAAVVELERYEDIDRVASILNKPIIVDMTKKKVLVIDNNVVYMMRCE